MVLIFHMPNPPLGMLVQIELQTTSYILFVSEFPIHKKFLIICSSWKIILLGI